MFTQEKMMALDALEKKMDECERQIDFLRKVGFYDVAKDIEAVCASYNRQHNLICCGVDN